MTVSTDSLPNSISWIEIRKVFDSMPIRIALLDRNHHFRYVNPEYCNYARIPEGTILGRSIAETWGEKHFMEVYPMYERALAGETAE